MYKCGNSYNAVGQLPGYPVSDSSIKFNMSPHVIFMCSLLAVTCSVSQLRFSSQKWPSVDTSCSVLDESLNQAKCSAAVLPSFLYFRYRKRYLKRRLLYSMNHPGSYNPCVITNQEVYMVNGNIDRPGSSENQKTKKRKASTISDYFSKVAPGKKYLAVKLKNSHI